MINQFSKILFISITFLFVARITKAQKEYIVTVDPSNGIITKIDSIPGLMWILTTSAYNQSTKKCTVIGRWELQEPHLFTVDAISGNTISSPILPTAGILNFQYSRSTGILYGIIFSGGLAYLATINTTTGTYSIIHEIPGLGGVLGDFTIDEANQRMFIPLGHGLLIIDLVTGNILSNVALSQPITDPKFDNVTNKLYGITSQPGPPPGNSIFSLCTIDLLSGNVTIVASLPDITGYFGQGYTTFNENESVYFFVADYQGSGTFLYSVSVNTGNTISRVAIPTSGVVDYDNLIFFRYDNISSKLYALLWEAHSAIIPIDSSCRIDLKTKIYPNPLNQILIVDKNPTSCSVSMNIYNTLGQLILKDRIINDGHNEIKVSNFTDGIYYYQFISGNKILLSGQFLKH